MTNVKFSFLFCIVYCSENRLKINVTPNGDFYYYYSTYRDCSGVYWLSGILSRARSRCQFYLCVFTRITQSDYYVRFSPPYPPGSITMENASDTRRVNTPFPIHILYRYGLGKGMMPYNFRNTHPILIKRVPN